MNRAARLNSRCDSPEADVSALWSPQMMFSTATHWFFTDVRHVFLSHTNWKCLRRAEFKKIHFLIHLKSRAIRERISWIYLLLSRFTRGRHHIIVRINVYLTFNELWIWSINNNTLTNWLSFSSFQARTITGFIQRFNYHALLNSLPKKLLD